MDKMMQKQIHVMAQQMWDSAARPYGMALDFWLMAEKMLVEAATTIAKMQNVALSSPRLPNFTEWPTYAAPVDRIQALAECMRQTAGNQLALSNDYWTAAAKHIFAMHNAINAIGTAPIQQQTKEVVTKLATMSPPEYLEHIRVMAYESWENAEEQYGSAFDHWLKAEQDVLSLFVAASRGVEAELAEPMADVVVTPEAPTKTESAPKTENTPKKTRRRAPAKKTTN
jgi:hypothetical protein